MGSLRLKRRRTIRIATSVLASLILVAAIGFATLLKYHHVSADATCPCSIFTSTTPTYSTYNDHTTETFGIRFQPEIDGYITGVKFYKDASLTGTHKGSLWDTYGNQLATGSFTSETASGWQTLTFSSPVAVTANTTYTASYTSSTGSYVATSSYFTPTPFDNPPLRALSTAQSDAGGNGSNGVYAVGDNIYPKSTFNGGNYWADVVFDSGSSTTPPTISSVTPSANASNVGVGTSLTAQFDSYLNTSSLTSSTVTVVDQHGATIPATLSFNQSTKLLTILPNALLPFGTTYTVTLKGGASGIEGLNGKFLAADYTWQFTTQATSGCPCSVFNRQALTSTSVAASDSPVTLGVKIQAAEAGYIAGLRFYRQALTTAATHNVYLYTTGGALLGSGTTTEETATGWQTAIFSTPVHIAGNTPYVLAYTASDGRYNRDTNLTTNLGSYPIQVLQNSSTYTYTPDTFPNSNSFANFNYWIDPIFTESATFTPTFTVDSVQPTDQSYGVDTRKPIVMRFSKSLDSSTTAGSVTLKTAAGQTIPGTTTYDATVPGQLTFTPSSQLAYSTSYVLSIKPSLKSVFGTPYSGNGIQFTTGVAATTTLNDGKGGPILVVTSATNKFSTYTAEILRSEGINYFTVADVSTLSTALLANYNYVLLGSTSLSTSQVSELTSWVNTGGNLVAFRPDKQLAPLLGLTDAGGTLANAYLKINTATAPGLGIVSDTIQYHTTADDYTVSGATAVATLYSDATTPTFNPAVTMHTVGSGHAAAFTYDLPQSIVLTHQGNPAWINHLADGPGTTRRPDNLFRYSGQPDWIDRTKASIPQADEQQRLLVNILTQMSTTTTKDSPLPHYWYLPHGYKAALEMTSDDHGTNGGTANFMNQVDLTNATNCSIVDWTCNRAGSLIYVSGGPTVAQANLFSKLGYPIGVHVQTGCSNFNDTDTTTAFTNQINNLTATYPALPPQHFGRLHCYLWNGWADYAKIDNQFGIHYTMEYEWYPPSWTTTYAGLLTGSTQVMRFADIDGTLIDTYNAPTDLDYETDPSTASMDADFAGAMGASGYYGIYGTHYDYSNSYDILLQSAARQYGMPIISAQQALDWKNAQSNSTFAILSSTNYKLVFQPQVAEGGEGSVVMLPTTSTNGTLNSLTVDGSSVSYSTSTIKGVTYAAFNAVPGTYTATYGAVPIVPPVTTPPASTVPQSRQYSTIFSNGSIPTNNATDTTPTVSNTPNTPQKAVPNGLPTNPDTPENNKPKPLNGFTEVVKTVAKVGAGAVAVAAVGGGGWWLVGAIRRRNDGDGPSTPLGL